MFLVVSPFYFHIFGSSLLSLHWILFQVDCLFPLHLFGLVGFCLAPSPIVCFSVFSFCITYCVWGLLFTGCMFIVPVVFGICPQWLRLVQWVVLASWWRGTGACVLVDEGGSCLSVGQDHIWWCVLGCLWTYYDFRQPCYADGRDVNCQQPLWRSVRCVLKYLKNTAWRA